MLLLLVLLLLEVGDWVDPCAATRPALTTIAANVPVRVRFIFKPSLKFFETASTAVTRALIAESGPFSRPEIGPISSTPTSSDYP